VRKYVFGTFSDRTGADAIISRIRAYSGGYQPTWDGCVVIEVEADSPKEANRLARQRRLEIERMAS
jgi:hypothetical protein